MTPNPPSQRFKDATLFEVESILYACEAEHRLFRQAADRFHGKIARHLHALQIVLADSKASQKSDSRKTGVSPKTNYKRLSEREIQILKLIAEGNGTKQAAHAMGIAYKTAEGHRSKLMTKLGIHDSVSLTHYAIRVGLVDP
jgi:DNA-binding NarL/FixJ family response regulator